MNKPRNFVAKHSGINKGGPHRDKLKHIKTIGFLDIYECYACYGEGIDDDGAGHVTRCSVCNGSGEISYEDY